MIIHGIYFNFRSRSDLLSSLFYRKLQSSRLFPEFNQLIQQQSADKTSAAHLNLDSPTGSFWWEKKIKMEDCGYQRWHCELKIDGMHPQNAPLSAIFFLRFWDNGGISGAKERNRDDENLMFNRLSRSTSGVKNAGDVFGDWSSSEISFTLVTRHQPCKWEVNEKFVC